MKSVALIQSQFAFEVALRQTCPIAGLASMRIAVPTAIHASSRRALLRRTARYFLAAPPFTVRSNDPVLVHAGTERTRQAGYRSGSEFDLGAEFDDAIGRQLEEVRRRTGIAEHPHEQDLSP